MITPSFADTIAAIATAPGRSAVALVRVSGANAVQVLHRLAPGLNGIAPSPRVQRLVALQHPETGERLDRALATVFSSPASFTGEDVVELATHGGTLTPQLVLDACYAAGARPALPGEFTRRALLNGKLDLLQAEAILDLIEGSSPALHRAAIHQVEKGLSGRIDTLRQEVLRLEALVSYGIDFPDEDEPPVPSSTIHAAAGDVLDHMEGILSMAPQGEMLREGAMVVLAGLPNSGKSSLFNALIGVQRAIVTELPGTTRDAVEASVTLDGYPFRLVDTAGLRETEDRVEAIGVEVARRYLEQADITVVCTEAGSSLQDAEAEFIQRLDPERTVQVLTKIDLGGRRMATPLQGLRSVELSVLSGEGLPELRAHLLEIAFGGIRELGDAPLVTRERHRRALRAAADELLAFRAALEDGVPMELAATHLGAAGLALEDLIGAVTQDDVLGAVFSQFCVGK
jgi:tRNA modification GTPase